MQTYKNKKDDFATKVCSHCNKLAEIVSVFGVKGHRAQLYLHVSHVSVCVSSWSAPLAFAVGSRPGSLLLTLLLLCPRFLLWVCLGSFKRPTGWFKHNTDEWHHRERDDIKKINTNRLQRWRKVEENRFSPHSTNLCGGQKVYFFFVCFQVQTCYHGNSNLW